MRIIPFLLSATILASAQDARVAALGASLAREIRQRTTVIANPAVLDYVERIGNRLAVELPDANFIYRFALISDDTGGETHEPLSLPGGYIFVPGALIHSALSETELAAMLAHAMAHPTLPLPKSATSTIPVIFIGGWQGLGPSPDGSPVPTSLFKAQRENEARADAIAIQAMHAAGYDPEAFIDYLTRVQQPGKGESPRLFAVLRDRDTRVAALRPTIAELPARTYPAIDPGEFLQIQELLREIVPAAKERERPTLKRRN